ncbi:MAG TPA: hypothetical protein VG095_10360 [Chthoniobacterales bacterium]|nr:hypothetical protein [Chthoniobacterales bacterium]
MHSASLTNSSAQASVFLRGVLLILLAWSFPQTGGAAPFNFAGTPLTPGATARAQVPIAPQLQRYVSEGGNAVPPYAVAVLAVPPGFDPNKSWPVLVCISTSDFQRKNRDDLEDFYRQPALAEGWVVLAGDGENNPRQDAAGWRAGMTLAALDALHRSFPGSKRWPIAVAGYSGGAKRAGTIAPLLAVAGERVIGIFLSGINEDRLVEGYRRFQPGARFLQTPVYISAGQADQVARFTDQQSVKRTLEHAGFSNVRLEPTPHGHAVSRGAVREALRWFKGKS